MKCDTKSDKMDVSLLSTDPRNCEKCDYEAEDMYDLDAHTWDIHDESNVSQTFGNNSDLRDHKKESLNDNQYRCNLCDDCFQNKRDLMQHKKIHHNNKVAQCWKFSAGNCEYGDKKCWFNHTIKDTQEIECVWCDKVFRTQSDLYAHRKQHHKQYIQSCKNYKNGACIYGNDKCWFLHENMETGEEIENEKENIIQKMMQMMEKMTERMIKLEDSNKYLQESYNKK